MLWRIFDFNNDATSSLTITEKLFIIPIYVYVFVRACGMCSKFLFVYKHKNANIKESSTSPNINYI